MDLLTPSSLGVFQLSLTTNSSWLPWGRVAMPLISPLMQLYNVENSAKPNIRLFTDLSNFIIQKMAEYDCT